MTFGVITLAFGPQKYIRQAEAMALSLKRHMPDLPVALITDRTTPNPIFDACVPVDLTRGGGTIQKIWLDHYTPYDETFFIDSDCLVTRPFKDELAAIRQFDFAPVVTKCLTKTDQDNFIEDLDAALTQVGAEIFPKYNGGVYYFKKNAVGMKVFEVARELKKLAKQLGVKNFDKAGPGDETLIGLAMGKLGIDKFYNDGGNLMRALFSTSGPIKLDVLGGGSSFMKEGERVTPAIVHFAGPYSQYGTYAYNAFLIHHPNLSAPARKAAEFYLKVYCKLRNKWKGLR